MAKPKIRLDIDQGKENRRAARAVIGEPSRGRKRGPHRAERQSLVNDYTKSELAEALDYIEENPGSFWDGE